LDWGTTNAALISDERNREWNEHYDQNDALFIFRELENSEQPFHLALRSAASISITVSVMVSKAKHLWLLRVRPD
jgi:hypothetical protein